MISPRAAQEPAPVVIAAWAEIERACGSAGLQCCEPKLLGAPSRASSHAPASNLKSLEHQFAGRSAGDTTQRWRKRAVPPGKGREDDHVLGKRRPVAPALPGGVARRFLVRQAGRNVRRLAEHRPARNVARRAAVDPVAQDRTAPGA